ncbi:MAG: phosphotransferase [Acidimicrobiia bacterium]
MPRRIDELSAPWLSRLLGNRYPGIAVEDLEIVDVKSSHTTKVRLRLKLNDVGRAAGIPENVCIKTNWSGMHTGEICEREARFYHLLSTGLDFPVPLSFYSDWDDDSRGNGIVVMEDLALSPGAFGLSSDHLGIDAVATGLETLARIHGAMWGDPRLATWDWLKQNMDTDNDTEQVVQYWNYIHFNLADPEFQDAVPSWVLETPELMAHVLDELAAYEREQLGPRCLVHGDTHQGNSFLRADGQRVWVDWQLVRKGSPARDVEYWLVSSLTVDERRSADRDLVEHYRQALIATGAEGVPSADDLWQQVIRWPGYGGQAWLGNITVWGQSSGAEMVRRHFAAAEDWDTVKLLTSGRAPRRNYVPGEGAYRLPRQLQQQLDERRG